VTWYKIRMEGLSEDFYVMGRLLVTRANLEDL